MNGLKCEGDESNLAMCKHGGYNNHNCDYTQIVGVTCVSEIGGVRSGSGTTFARSETEGSKKKI